MPFLFQAREEVTGRRRIIASDVTSPSGNKEDSESR
jgi:hypothetical protein